MRIGICKKEFACFRTFQSPWSWVCNENRCERRAVRSSRTSFATCAATCGGNTRLIWPRPTGNTILSSDHVTFHFQQIELITLDTNDEEVRNLLEQAKEVFLGRIILTLNFHYLFGHLLI